MGFRGDAAGFGRGGGMIWPVVSAAGLIGSLASFQWGMRKLFTQPGGDNAGLKLIRVCGSAFALLHPHGHCRHAPRRRVASSGRRLLVLIRPGPVLVGHPRQSGPTAFAAFSPDDPLHRVQQGPYHVVRHPLYCSYLLVWIAGVVATDRLWLIPTALAMGIVYARAAGMEEGEFARSSLAGAYQNYQSRTGMFFPNPVKALRSARTGRQRAAAASAR